MKDYYNFNKYSIDEMFPEEKNVFGFPESIFEEIEEEIKLENKILKQFKKLKKINHNKIGIYFLENQNTFDLPCYIIQENKNKNKKIKYIVLINNNKIEYIQKL